MARAGYRRAQYPYGGDLAERLNAAGFHLISQPIEVGELLPLAKHGRPQFVAMPFSQGKRSAGISRLGARASQSYRTSGTPLRTAMRTFRLIHSCKVPVEFRREAFNRSGLKRSMEVHVDYWKLNGSFLRSCWCGLAKMLL
jgi:hypothetical protein